MGKKFELRTDHNCMKYLFGQPNLNDKQRRRLEFLGEYDFDINHIKGKENKVVGACSIRVHEFHATTISMYQAYLKDRILEAAKSYLHYLEMVTNLQQGIFQREVEYYKLGDEKVIM
jgi:hypothetical protein